MQNMSYSAQLHLCPFYFLYQRTVKSGLPSKLFIIEEHISMFRIWPNIVLFYKVFLVVIYVMKNKYNTIQLYLVTNVDRLKIYISLILNLLVLTYAATIWTHKTDKAELSHLILFYGLRNTSNCCAQWCEEVGIIELTLDAFHATALYRSILLELIIRFFISDILKIICTY